MKKLMTMIAAVATAFGLYAADTGTSFEGTATAGGTLADEVTKINELSGGASSADWWYGATDKATIKEYGDETPYSPRPTQYTGAQYTYLKLETGTDELTRYTDSAKAGVNVLTLTDKEYVFDSLVNLTAFEDAPEMTDGKLAVWLQDLSDAEEPVAQTNLMVSMLVNAAQVNYNCGNLSDLNLDLIGKWARVTIKALDIGNSKIGFVVYINGSNNPIASTDEIDYTSFTLNDVAQFYANNKQLFPYAGNTNIGSVGFKGMGSVDDLVFTETVPSFAADPSLFKLTVGAGITSFKATYNGVTKTYDGTTPVTFVYSASANPQKVVLSNVECTTGMFLKTMEFTVDGSNITIPDAVVAVAQVGENQYDDLNEAVAAASGKTLKLLANVATNLTIGANMTLDLNGLETAGITAGNNVVLTIDDTSASTGIIKGVLMGKAGPSTSILVKDGKILKETNPTLHNKVHADEGKYFKDDGTYWVLEAIQQVATPTATPGLVYNGTERIGVAAAEAYKTISGNTATAAGDYKAVITLKDGYVWENTEFNGEVEWSIAKVAVTVTADTKSMKAGEALPTFTYQITSGALIDGETLKGTLTVNTDGTKAGEFDIVQANDWVNNNYDVTYVGAKLTVEKAEESVPDLINGGSEQQKTAYDEWVKNTAGSVTDPTATANIDRFIMGVPAATPDADLKAIAETELNALITENDALTKLIAGQTVDLTALKAKYPNATIEFVEVSEGGLQATANSKFWRLKFSFTPANVK